MAGTETTSTNGVTTSEYNEQYYNNVRGNARLNQQIQKPLNKNLLAFGKKYGKELTSQYGGEVAWYAMQAMRSAHNLGTGNEKGDYSLAASLSSYALNYGTPKWTFGESNPHYGGDPAPHFAKFQEGMKVAKEKITEFQTRFTAAYAKRYG